MHGNCFEMYTISIIVKVALSLREERDRCRERGRTKRACRCGSATPVFSQRAQSTGFHLPHKTGLVLHTHQLDTQKLGAGRPEIQTRCWLYSKTEANLGYMKLCLKKIQGRKAKEKLDNSQDSQEITSTLTILLNSMGSYICRSERNRWQKKREDKPFRVNTEKGDILSPSHRLLRQVVGSKTPPSYPHAFQPKAVPWSF